MRRLPTFLLFSIGTLIAGCAWLFDPADLPTREGLTDAGDSGLDSEATPDAFVETCLTAVPNGRPKPSAAPDGPVRALAFATFKLSANPSRGFDLDGRCTCTPDTGIRGGPSCVRGNAPTVPSCDREGGLDNAIATVAGSISPLFGGGSIDVGYDLAARTGRAATLIELSAYSGADDDEEVHVAVYDSPGLEPFEACPTGTTSDAGANDAGQPLPTWGGCDRWMVSSDSVVSGLPKTFTRDAWVSGKTLVAKFGILPLHAGPVVLELRDAILTGQLTTERPQRLDTVTLGGRVSSRDVLRVFGEQRTNDTSPPICLSRDFNLVAGKVCAELDLSSKANTDGTAPCDSISFAFEGTAITARLGKEAAPNDSTTNCSDAGDFALCP